MTERIDAGFTLVELLIAVALLGMLTMLAYSAVVFGNLSWRHANIHRDADIDRGAVKQLLTQSIANAYPGYASADINDTTIAFTGTQTTLDIIAPLPEALSPGIMAAEHFSLGSRDDQSSLIMSWRINLPAATGGPLPTQTTPVAGLIKSVRFSYFGRLKRDKAAGWFDRWTGMEWLPELVRVRIWREGVTTDAWMDFTVEPKVTVNVSCLYDPLSFECRRQ